MNMTLAPLLEVGFFFGFVAVFGLASELLEEAALLHLSGRSVRTLELLNFFILAI
jgi:hypothetical protein